MAAPGDKQGEQMEQLNKERAAREMQRVPVINSWPHDEEGNPMTIVMGACSDLIPTVQYGNVVVGPVTIMRPVAVTDLQAIGDAARETQRMAEFVVGAERRLLQWAIDPASKIANPVTGQDAFAAPPPGYDPSKLPQTPGDQAAAATQPPSPAAVPAPAAPATPPPAGGEMPNPLDVHQDPPAGGDNGVSVG